MSELKPCPCCGRLESAIKLMNVGTYRVFCGYCRLCIPGCESRGEAVEKWNTRADEWIDAKENPPPKSCQVIAEWSNGDIEQSSYITDWGKPHFQRRCGTDESGTGWHGNVGHVVNWMPLPAPKALK